MNITANATEILTVLTNLPADHPGRARARAPGVRAYRAMSLSTPVGDGDGATELGDMLGSVDPEAKEVGPASEREQGRKPLGRG